VWRRSQVSALKSESFREILAQKKPVRMTTL
jgi:hypothetical protein